MTVVPYEPRTPVLWWQEMNPVDLAERVANTDFVKSSLRGNVPAIFACLMYGNEVGVGPMQSLAHISVIEGRPTMSSELQRALIERAGHDIEVRETTITRCTIAGRRRGQQRWTEVTWTMDDAKRANLAGRPNWQRYPRAMLEARASAELARLIFADVIGGLAATEELEGARDDPTPSPDTPKRPAGVTRRRRGTVAAVPDQPGQEGPGPEAAANNEPEPTPNDAPPAVDQREPEPDTQEAGTPPPPMPAPEPALMNDSQRRKLMALYRERSILTREDRLSEASAFLGREIQSASELTSTEASRLIEHLEGGLPEPVQQALDQAHPDE
ncbi:MAG TPA: hypothetical protein VKB57_23720 [Acidimicrobiales bacterium]|nr:hypothetical protein [Acidimicrobiales bacterium]